MTIGTSVLVCLASFLLGVLVTLNFARRVWDAAKRERTLDYRPIDQSSSGDVAGLIAWQQETLIAAMGIPAGMVGGGIGGVMASATLALAREQRRQFIEQRRAEVEWEHLSDPRPRDDHRPPATPRPSPGTRSSHP